MKAKMHAERVVQQNRRERYKIFTILGERSNKKNIMTDNLNEFFLYHWLTVWLISLSSTVAFFVWCYKKGFSFVSFG